MNNNNNNNNNMIWYDMIWLWMILNVRSLMNRLSPSSLTPTMNSIIELSREHAFLRVSHNINETIMKQIVT